MITEKTTVYLNAADHRRLKALAAADNRSTAELIREAVAEYVGRRAARAAPSSIGAGRSGEGDLAARAEDLLAGFGES
jgi:predicted transcriptional regulator